MNNFLYNLQESRQFIFERLSWCLTKLSAVEKNLDRCELEQHLKEDLSEDSMFVTPMYFVNWIDYTFDILSKLAENVYRTDYKDNEVVLNDWKESVSILCLQLLYKDYIFFIDIEIRSI